jgi:hypothetical protein
MYNLEMIQKWVDALRSGNYKQSKNYLKKEGTFYCLSVYVPKELSCRISQNDLSHFVKMNDDGYSFSTIANAIENEYFK